MFEPGLRDADNTKRPKFSSPSPLIDTVQCWFSNTAGGVSRPGSGMHSTTARISKAATDGLMTMISDGDEVKLGASREVLPIRGPWAMILRKLEFNNG